MQEISYLPGEGTVIVSGDTVLLLAAPPDAEVSTTLWRLVVAGMSHDQVRTVLETYSPARLPELGVASLRPDGLTLLLRGSVSASVTEPRGTSTYRDDDLPRPTPPGDRRVWTEYTIAGATALRLWLGGPDHAPGAPRVDHALPLVGGVVRADSVVAGLAGPAAPRHASPGYTPAIPVHTPPLPAQVRPMPAAPPMEGVFLDRAEVAAPPSVPAAIGSISQVWVTPTPAAPPVPPPVPTPAHQPAPHLATTDPAPSGSAPLVSAGASGQRPAVWAARCPQAHLNAPDAGACRVCGAPIVDRELSIVSRPPLGRLDFGQFGTVALDDDVVIGRQPGDQSADGARHVTIAHESLSRRHAQVQVRDWLVAVVDLNSANGTTVVLPGRDPQPLRANDPVPIHPGTVVWLSQQVAFTYVGHE